MLPVMPGAALDSHDWFSVNWHKAQVRSTREFASTKTFRLRSLDVLVLAHFRQRLHDFK